MLTTIAKISTGFVVETIIFAKDMLSIKMDDEIF